MNQPATPVAIQRAMKRSTSAEYNLNASVIQFDASLLSGAAATSAAEEHCMNCLREVLEAKQNLYVVTMREQGWEI